jgi:hypothetical protein
MLHSSSGSNKIGFSSASANFKRAASLLNLGSCTKAKEETNVLWTVFAILLVLWMVGWGFHVAGSLIHLLLVVAVVIGVANLLTGRRAV